MTNEASPALERARALVQQTFPGVAMVTLNAGATFLGIEGKTLRNLVWRKKAPVATAKVGGRRLIPTDSLAAALAQALSASGIFEPVVSPPAVNKQQTVGSGPGKPKKAESLAASKAGMTVPQWRRANQGEVQA